MTVKESSSTSRSVVDDSKRDELGDDDCRVDPDEKENRNVMVEEKDEEIKGVESTRVDGSGSGSGSGWKDDDGSDSHNDNEGERKEEVVEIAPWWMQTWALMVKNAIAKGRTKGTTLFELVSPGLLLMFLVLGYSMSEVRVREAATYDDWYIKLPGPYLSLARSAAASTLNTPFNEAGITSPLLPNLTTTATRRRTASSSPLTQSVIDMDSDSHQVDDPWQGFRQMLLDTAVQLDQQEHHHQQQQQQTHNHKRMLQAAPDDTNATVMDDQIPEDNQSPSIDSLNGIRSELFRFLRSPIPIPTLPIYVELSRALSGLINPSELDEAIQRSDIVRRWGNLLTLGTLHIAPMDSPLIDQFITYLETAYDIAVLNRTTNPNDNVVQITTNNDLTIRLHSNQDSALSFILDNLNERTWAMIDFGDTAKQNINDNDIGDFKYTIRMNSTTLPNTSRITNWVAIGLSWRYQLYYRSGYLTLQRTLNEFALSRLRNSTADNNQTDPSCDGGNAFGTFGMPFPTPKYNQNPFFTAVGNLLGLTITMAYSYQVSRLVKSIVEEKESRMKETLAILGVRPLAHWISWLSTAFISFFISGSLVVYILSSSLMKFSDASYLASFIALFSCAIIGFSFFIASLFSRAKLASIIGPIALFVTLLPRWIFFDTNRYEAVQGKVLVSLMPCAAFAFGADILADYEYAEIGINRDTASEGGYSFNTSLGMLFFDAIFYTALAWYMDEVIPRQYGVARKWYFCVTPSYISDTCQQLFSCLKFRNKNNTNNVELVDSGSSNTDEESQMNPNVEKVDDSYRPTVFIKNLVKNYNPRNKEQKPAVNNMTLTMYESQITCLLGHNGAGKTTTISVLTGLYKPTSGSCVIYGKSISNHLNAARRSMGICPQHNILFNNLTVEEHLAFFERIKGLKPNKESIKERAEEVGLRDFMKTKSCALSGGNKRKLHVAIAFCGNPEFLLFDEPTSGMDPYSRRATWDLLRRKRTGRVTLLTTHFMDEAELLADRIAVMKEGQLQCCGSNLFLKKRFNLGYSLTLVTEDQKPPSDEAIPQANDTELSIASSEQLNTDTNDSMIDENHVVSISNASTDYITSFIQERVPGTSLVRKAGRELVYRFPQGGENKFPTLFSEIEENRKNLGIGSYGATNTTLEEVFLQLAQQEEPDDSTDYDNTKNRNESSHARSQVKSLEAGSSEANLDLEKDSHATGIENDQNVMSTTSDSYEFTNFVSQVGLLVKKRFTVQKRDRKGFFFGIILPVVLSGLVLLILMIEWRAVGPAIDLSVNLYKSTSSGAASRATSLVGGGAGTQNLDSVNATSDENIQEIIVDDVSKLNEICQAVYPDAEYKYIENATNSSMMSQHMLKTYSDPARAINFGAMIMNDRVNVTINLSRVDLENELYTLMNTSLFMTFPLVNLTDFVGVEGTELTFNITEDDLNIILDDNNISENTTNITEISNTFNDFIDVFNNLNISINEDDISDLFELINSTEALNSTVFANVTEDDLNEFINDNNITNIFNNSLQFDTNVTIGELLDIFNEAIFGNASEMIGSVSINPGSVILDLANLTIIVSSLEVETNIGNIRLAGDITFALMDLLAEFAETDTFNFQFNTDASVMHNSSSPHAVAVFHQAHDEYVYMKCSKTKNRLISMNHPLPLTSQQSTENKTLLSIFASLFLLIPYCYIPASFCVFLVKERISKSKHLQLVSGVDMTAYWVSSFIWDLFLWMILTCLIMCIFSVYGADSAQVFVGDMESFFCTAALTFGYGISGLPFAYLFSRFFNNHSNAQISIMALFFVTGFVAVNAHYILDNLPDTKHIAKGLRPLFFMWPPYNIGEGLIALSLNFFQREVLRNIKSPFAWEVCGRSLTLLYGLSVPYFSLLLILECSTDGGSGGSFGRISRWLRDVISLLQLKIQGVKYDKNGGTFSQDNGASFEDNVEVSVEDSDVQNERHMVNKNKVKLKSTASIMVANLWKVYPKGSIFSSLYRFILRRTKCVICKKKNDSIYKSQNHPKMAVKGLTTAVMNGETFGLLGVNGAGKTTTLGILTGDLRPTGGEAYICGYDVTGTESRGVAMARKNTGFCPQVDPLIDLMTGRETLCLFGRLRGIPRKMLNEAVSSLLDMLTLTPHADKISASYSGGNKRKLSLGIALIGNPAVMFIDEASSGMDPLARRKMWDLIAEAARKRSVILTTHSMEEAEALCTRVAIMIGGKIRCLGSVQHLKNKFLGGYAIEIHCKAHVSQETIDSVKNQIFDYFPGCVVSEEYGRFLKIDLPSLIDSESSKSNLGSVFSILQSMKNDRGGAVEEYSVSQCTLEQVFISLVQEDEVDRNIVVDV